MIQQVTEFSRKVEKNKHIHVVIQILITGYIFFHLFFKMYHLPWINQISALTALVVCSLTFITYMCKFSKVEYMIAGYLSLLIIWSSLTQHNDILRSHYYYVVLIAYCFGIVTAQKGLNRIVMFTLFFAVTATFLYGFLIMKIDSQTFSRFVFMNRNGIPLYQLLAAILFYMSGIVNNIKRPLIWPSLITLYISYLSRSRAGILLAFLLVVIIFTVNMHYFLANKVNKQKINFNKIIIVIFVTMILIVLSVVLYQKSRFAQQGIESHGRIYIYTHFIEELTFKRILLGFHPSFIGPIYAHLHNSYLQLFSYVGIASFPVFASIFWIIYKLWKNHIFLACLFSIFCIYSLMEYRLFINLADVVFFPPLMLAIKEHQKQREAANETN